MINDNDTSDDYIDAWYDECPNCGAVFSGDEYIAQHCAACGWKHGDAAEADVDGNTPWDGYTGEHTP